MTQNPINAFKITIYDTKHTKNTTMYFKNPPRTENIQKHLKKWKMENGRSSCYLILYRISISYILYFLCTFYMHLLMSRTNLRREKFASVGGET